MFGIIIKLLVAAVLGFAAAAYYSLVLPYPIAALVGIGIGGALLWSMLGGGFKMSAALFGGASIAAWPAGALAIGGLGQLTGFAFTPAQQLGGAWVFAILAALASYALAIKRDRARDVGGLSLGVICLYSIIATALAGDLLAMGFAAIGAGAVATMTQSQMILPPSRRLVFRSAGTISALAGVVMCGRFFLAG